MTAESPAPPPTLDSQLSTRSRFAILTHDHPFVHWDLLLEDGDTARTWRLLESPARLIFTQFGKSVPAEEIAAHRLDYLSYEGPVGRERGTVSQWDAGHFEWVERTDSQTRITISGRQLYGDLKLMPLQRERVGSVVFRPD